jgi:hypothetical protein
MEKVRFNRAAAILAYIKHAELGTDDKDYFWGWDAITSYLRDASAEDAWDLTIELLRRAPDAVLGSVAVGPLEDVIKEHGAALVDWIEGEAGRDERFKWALGRIWVSRGQLPQEIEERIVAASGGKVLVLGIEP